MSNQAKYLKWVTLIIALTFSGIIMIVITITEYKEYLSHEEFIRLTGTIKRIERKGDNDNLITFTTTYQNEILEHSFTSDKELKEKQLTIGLNTKDHNDFIIYELEENHLKNAKESLIGFFFIIFLIHMSVIFKDKISTMEDNLFGHSS